MRGGGWRDVGSVAADLVWAPLSELARALLQQAVQDPDGVAIKGKPAKVAARDLCGRGLGALNKSETRLVATPAGRWAQGQVGG